MNIKNIGNRLSIAQKLAAAISAGVLISYAITAAVIYTSAVREIERESLRDLQSILKQTKDFIVVFDATAKTSAEKMMEMFISFFPEKFSLLDRKIKIGDFETPVVQSGGMIINTDYTTVDKFARIMTGGVATIFVKSGDNFVRVSTSLKKEDGSRAVGAALDREHPGYEKIKNGEGYLGKAELFGKHYMTKYQPIKDRSGAVIGCLFVGFDINETMNKLIASIKSIKVVETGYMYVIDSREGKSRGLAVIHPTMEGKNILHLRSADGREIIKEALDKKEGVLVFPMLSESGQSDAKTVAVDTYGRLP